LISFRSSIYSKLGNQDSFIHRNLEDFSLDNGKIISRIQCSNSLIYLKIKRKRAKIARGTIPSSQATTMAMLRSPPLYRVRDIQRDAYLKSSESNSKTIACHGNWVPESLHDEVLTNADQLAEWKTLTSCPKRYQRHSIHTLIDTAFLPKFVRQLFDANTALKETASDFPFQGHFQALLFYGKTIRIA